MLSRPAPVGPGGFVMPRWRVRVLGLLVACCLWPHGCCGRRRARPPARLGVLTSFGAAPRSPPVPSGPSGALHTSGVFVADVARRVGSLSGQAPPPTGTAAWPSGLSGALHTSEAWCADRWLGVSPRCPAIPRRRPRAPQPGPASALAHIASGLSQFRMQFPRGCLNV